MASLNGHLEMICAASGGGASSLRHQSFSAPFHLSKTHWNGRALVAQIVNPTAGVFAGDRLRCGVSVESGASLHVTTPSASRIHTMRNANAELAQTFHVAAGGWLEFSPAPLIPQRGSRYRQRTEIRVEAGGGLYFQEALAPGRVAHGESFEYEEIDWEMNLWWAGRLNSAERFRLKPSDNSTASLRTLFPSSYYASCVVISPRLEPGSACWEPIRNLCSDRIQVGLSRLPFAGWTIKTLARDSVALSRALREIRSALSVSLEGLQSDARRI